MRYEVTFQVAGDERTEMVDAPDAASAVATVEAEYGRTPELFELIQVHLMEEVSSEDQVQAGATG
jgi:hypothetical protein